jgi:hypothetical protein
MLQNYTTEEKTLKASPLNNCFEYKCLQSGNILMSHYKCFYVAIQIIGQYLLFINFLLSIT